MSDFGKSGKERVREYKAMESILRGETPEKRIMVGYEGKKQKQGDIESPLTKIMQKVRMPNFCTKCDRIMNKNVDNQAWAQFGHCFDCQIELENKMRIEGTFEDYAKTKMLENQKAYLRDLEQSIDDFEKTGGKRVWLNQVGVNSPELEQEKWEMGAEQFDKTISDAREFIREKRELVEQAENEIQGAQ